MYFHDLLEQNGELKYRPNKDTLPALPKGVPQDLSNTYDILNQAMDKMFACQHTCYMAVQTFGMQMTKLMSEAEKECVLEYHSARVTHQDFKEFQA